MFAINSNLQEKINSNIPLDFDWKIYLSLNSDLEKAGISDELSAKYHYLIYGKNENRIYKRKKLINIDIDFDYRFYLNEYPDVKSYYGSEPHIPIEERLFHHYFHYGKAEGRFKNLYEYNRCFDDITELSDITYSDIELSNPANILQGIYLLTTHKEITNNRYQKFIQHLVAKTQRTDISKTIDLNIVLNHTHKTLSIGNTNHIFKSVNIIDLKLDPQEDVYLSTMPNHGQLPKYGLKSGPNITFFKTLQDASSKYNTILLLETDCILSDSWLINIYNYIRYTNGFLISGAIYDGNVFMKAGSPMLTHINGGTAIYASYHPALQHFVSILEKFLLYQVNNNLPGLAYDYAAKLLIDHQINHMQDTSTYNNFWKFINRNYLCNKLIGNCCTGMDANIDIDDINRRYKFSVLHKKQ